MFKRILLAVVTGLITCFSFAQTGKISGKVFNKKNEPVVNASVIIEGLKTGTKTNTDG
ncbi:MAG: hypothetical protein ABUT20_64315, partial [Bacteroidota bacterium]